MQQVSDLCSAVPVASQVGTQNTKICHLEFHAVSVNSNVEWQRLIPVRPKTQSCTKHGSQYGLVGYD